VTDFLSIDDVLILHANQVDLYGGEHGVRHPGLLESAVAAYLYHIVQNHPFFDGNKRTGAASAIVFSALNALRLTSTSRNWSI